MCNFAAKKQNYKRQNDEKTNLYPFDSVAHDDDGTIQITSVVAR